MTVSAQLDIGDYDAGSGPTVTDFLKGSCLPSLAVGPKWARHTTLSRRLEYGDITQAQYDQFVKYDKQTLNAFTNLGKTIPAVFTDDNLEEARALVKGTYVVPESSTPLFQLPTRPIGGGVAAGPNFAGPIGGGTGVAAGPNFAGPIGGGVAAGPNFAGPVGGGIAAGPNFAGPIGGGAQPCGQFTAPTRYDVAEAVDACGMSSELLVKPHFKPPQRMAQRDGGGKLAETLRQPPEAGHVALVLKRKQLRVINA